MPRDTKLYTVLIASPSDLQIERQLLKQAIHDWNVVHWRRDGIVLLPLMWETDVHPAGGEPQENVNRQIVDEADILIAVFWYRIGTPTRGSRSGTAEEIERFLKTGKKSALIYFSEANIPIDHDPDQLHALKNYRASLKGTVFYRTFKDPQDLYKMVSGHLALLMNELVTAKSGISILRAEEIVDLRKLQIRITGQGMLELSAAGGVALLSVEYLTAEGASFGKQPFGRFMPGSSNSMALDHERLFQIYNLKPRVSSENVPIQLKVEYVDSTLNQAQEIYLNAVMSPILKPESGGSTGVDLNVVLTGDIPWTHSPTNS